jgi:hypothetical protein
LSETGLEIVRLWSWYDGYPSGFGAELAEFLAGIKIVTSLPPRRTLPSDVITVVKIPSAQEEERIALTMGCLAAQAVAHFKEEPGYFLLLPAGLRGWHPDYIYVVSGREGEEPYIEVYRNHYVDEPELLFEGDATEVFVWADDNEEKFDNEEEDDDDSGGEPF